MRWVKIKQNENYSINENGEIRNDTTGNIKVPFINSKNGYKTVDLYKDGKSKKYLVHRLIAEAFIPNPDNKPTVDHKDGNRTNNSIDNLRWATYSEQNSRFKTVGVRSERIKVTRYLEKRTKNGNHISWEGKKEILIFDRIKDAAKLFDVSVSNISFMLKKSEIGTRGKMRGLMFEYLNKTV